MADRRPIDLAALARSVRERIALSSLIGESVVLKRRGREWSGLCPFHGERTPSFTVNDGKRFYHCFGCGAHGDAMRWLMHAHGLTFGAAVEELAARAGLIEPQDRLPRRRLPPPPPPDDGADKLSAVERALSIWRDAHPGTAATSLVPVYLRSRGISLAVPPTLRFAPALYHSDTGLRLPAMVAAVQGPDRRVVGVHRTYLRADGADKAGVDQQKKMLGVCWTGAIRLAAAGPALLIGEGIETTLSVMQATGLPGWAAGSLGNMAGSGRGRGTPHPTRAGVTVPSPRPDLRRPGLVLPPEVREVVLLADADGDRPIAEALMARAAERFRRAGLRVRVAWPPDGTDFNDMLRRAA